jgi:hypothetical protein
MPENLMMPKVKEWLEKQGFLLEMKTAAAFRDAGFEVRQSSHYVDPDTGKSREIDVLARDPDFLGIVDIQFTIECKASKKPWGPSVLRRGTRRLQPIICFRPNV